MTETTVGRTGLIDDDRLSCDSQSPRAAIRAGIGCDCVLRPVPGPAPLVMVSHATLLAAVQAHEASEAVTATEPVPPPTGAAAVAGATMNVQVIGVPGLRDRDGLIPDR